MPGRGGPAGWRLARVVARYHAQKYAYLKALSRGHYPEALRAYAEGRYADVVAAARALAGSATGSVA